MAEMYHITTSLPYDKKCYDMARTSRHLGFNFITTPQAGENRGYGPYFAVGKLQLSLAVIKSSELIRNSVVMFTDAHDVLMLLPASIIESRFKKMNCDFCISAEAFFWPNNEEKEEYRQRVKDFYNQNYSGPHCYPNSGCWIGYGWAAEKVLEVACKYAEENGLIDDQHTMQDIIFYNMVDGIKWGVDHEQKIFTSIVDNEEKLHLCGANVYSSDTQWECGLVHFNGHNKTWRDLSDLYNKIFNDCLDYKCSIEILKNRNGYYVCESNGSFYVSKEVNDKIIFLISNPSSNSFIIKGNGEIGSFNPNGEFKFIIGHLNSWEIKSVNNMISETSDLLKENIVVSFPSLSDIVKSGLVEKGEEIQEYYNMMF